MIWISLLVYGMLLFVAGSAFAEEGVLPSGMWELSYVINGDGDVYTPKECGGERMLYLMDNGRGLYETEEGYSSVSWSLSSAEELYTKVDKMLDSLERNGRIIGVNGAPYRELLNGFEGWCVYIEGEDFSLSFLIEEENPDVAYYYRYADGGYANIVFERTGDAGCLNKKERGWFISNGVLDDGMHLQMYRAFGENGDTYRGWLMYDQETEETALVTDFADMWWVKRNGRILVGKKDDPQVYLWKCEILGTLDTDEHMQAGGRDRFELITGMIGLKYYGRLNVYESVDRLPAADNAINIPIDYSREKYYRQWAGIWYAEENTDAGDRIYLLELDVNGAAHYYLGSKLIEMQPLEQKEYNWIPAAEGIKIWSSGGEENAVLLKGEANGLELVDLEGRIHNLNPAPQSYVRMMETANQYPDVRITDVLGVWDMSYNPLGTRESAQLTLCHDGKARYKKIFYGDDPRANYLENYLNLQWEITEDGVLLENMSADEDFKALQLTLEEGVLVAADSSAYTRIADYSSWKAGEYHSDQIAVDYSQSGYVGVWRTDDLDEWEGTKYIYLYLASNGTGKYVEENYGRATETALDWKPSEDGFDFRADNDGLFYINEEVEMNRVRPYFISSEMEWKNSNWGGIPFRRISDFWVPENSGLQKAIVDYTVNADGSITLTDYFINSSVIEIPDAIDGYSVIRIGEGLFQGNVGLEKIILPSSVIEIGANAFRNCYKLTHVELSEGLAMIGSNAFRDCTALQSVSIPGSVLHISEDAFNGCTMLQTLEIGYGVESIGAYAFRGCNSLGPVVFPDSLLTIGEEAFWGCGENMDITLSQNLVSIGDSAFEFCSGITGVTIPASLQNADAGAFANCRNLESVQLSEGLTMLGSSMFASCDGIQEVVIPGSMKQVGEGSFAGCDGLISVQMQEGVEMIGEDAFWDCTSLRDVHLPESLRSIGRRAFAGCSSLGHVRIPAGVSEFGFSAFGDGEMYAIPFVLVLDVEEGSYAHQYALEMGIPCSTGDELAESAAVNVDVDDSEAALLQALEGMRYYLNYKYDDFDGDGIYEMFVVVITGDEFSGECELWFVSPYKAEVVRSWMSEYDRVFVQGSEPPILVGVEEMYGETALYGVKNGEAVRVD